MSIKPQHATPADWAWLEGNSTVDRRDAVWSRGLITVRARIEALEAGATCPHVRTGDEGTSYCALAEQVAAMESAAPPAGSLVERVMIAGGMGLPESARAAIRAVAVAARHRGGQPLTWEHVAQWLEQEADR